LQLFEDSPSLKQYAPDIFAKAYKDAVKEASYDTGMSIADFPIDCPWTIEETMIIEPF
jgi:hypothetical protein